MDTRKAAAFVLTIVGYVVVTFAVQAISHFAVNAGHYADISFLRSQPIFVLGITSMVIQGAIFALLFPVFNRGGSALWNGVVFSCTLGAFLASYITLAEAAKYAIPSISTWFAVEASAAAAQYGLFGLVLGLVHRWSGAPEVLRETVLE